MEYTYKDLTVGMFEADVCDGCGRVFFTEKGSDGIDGCAMAMGIWGQGVDREGLRFDDRTRFRVPEEAVGSLSLGYGDVPTLRPQGR